MDKVEMLNEVRKITGRRDLDELTSSLIDSAILKCHTRDFYYRDIQEAAVSFDNPGHLITFDPRQVFPKYRKPAYIRRWYNDDNDSDNGYPGAQFEVVETGDARDNFGFYKTDVYYLAGNVLQIRSCTELKYILFGAYVFPDVVNGGTWITEDYPWAVIHEAAAQVFQSIGATGQMQAQMQQAADWTGVITVNSIPDEGR